jgi:hypothetical protein
MKTKSFFTTGLRFRIPHKFAPEMTDATAPRRYRREPRLPSASVVPLIIFFCWYSSLFLAKKRRSINRSGVSWDSGQGTIRFARLRLARLRRKTSASARATGRCGFQTARLFQTARVPNSSLANGSYDLPPKRLRARDAMRPRCAEDLPPGGRGECRVPNAPAASCAQNGKKCTRVFTAEAPEITRHSRTQWF